MVQAVVDTSAPSLFHQWFHSLKRTHNVQYPGSIHEIRSKYRSQNNVKYHVSGWAYLSEFECFFPFGYSQPRRELESFTSHFWRHVERLLCVKGFQTRVRGRCVSNGQGPWYICRSVASVCVRHGYAPKPIQNHLEWPRIREKQHKTIKYTKITICLVL